MPYLNVYVVDDDKAVLRALGALLLSQGYSVQTFASGEAFLEVAKLQQAGCVVLDLRMPGMSGLQVFEQLRRSGSFLTVLFLSGHGDISAAVSAVKNGAFGWLEKPCDHDVLLQNVEAALAVADERAAQDMSRQAARALWATLTNREREVGSLIAKGQANKLIARALNIDVRTVEAHRAKVFAKLDATSPVDLGKFIPFA